ncbi:MAG: radical SAM protein [Candidatus Dormibacteraeota bacterium]|nr:radical SAM protein [Candidatus Dormibacteraeota bacterium]
MRPLPVLRSPLEAYVEPTNRCNELCVTCPRTFFQREPEADLDLERFASVLDQMPDLERVVLHGLGEPLLARHLPAMVAEANRRGARVLFNTNALALHRRLAASLVAAGLDELRVSMDAIDAATYKKIRGVDGYEKAMRRTADFCRLLRDMGAERPRVSMYFMAMRENVADFARLIERAGQVGVHAVVFQRLVYFDEGLAVEAQSLMGEDISELLQRCQEAADRAGVELLGTGGFSPGSSLQPADAKRPWAGCTRPWRSTYITANGNVLPCCFAPFTARPYEGAILGNVFEQPLADIWNGPAYDAFRRAHGSDDPPQPCRDCGSRWMY